MPDKDERGRAGLSACLRGGYQRHVSCVARLENGSLEQLERLVVLVHDTFKRGGKLLACGNGGSASDAQHLVAELVGRYVEERKALPAIALNTDVAVLTSVANDYSFENVFARQVQALGAPGDLFLAISTSGRSPNIVAGLSEARARGLRTAALLGRDGGPAVRDTELAIVVPDQETARIQECHALMIHLLCEGLDRLLRDETGAR
jgi:D-sedoheptulose 7-phosphate isomerase